MALSRQPKKKPAHEAQKPRSPREARRPKDHHTSAICVPPLRTPVPHPTGQVISTCVILPSPPYQSHQPPEVVDVQINTCGKATGIPDVSTPSSCPTPHPAPQGRGRRSRETPRGPPSTCREATRLHHEEGPSEILQQRHSLPPDGHQPN